jgi:CRP/FNR family transcriptional regulator
MVNLEVIKAIPILADLNADQLSLISQKANFKTIKKKRRVYESGSSIENVYFVHKGSIKLGSDVGSHKSLVKHIAYDADVFGENMFLSTTRSEYAEAIKDSTIISIDVKTIQYLLGLNNGFANKITEVIIERINNLEQRMKNFIFMKAHKRISNFLKQTAVVRGIKIGIDEVLINHGMSHKDISYLTDTSRQTVTRVLADLKNNNLIHFSSRKPNKILIRQIASL